MRSNTADKLVAELDSEQIDPLTDGALGDDIIELICTIDRLERE
jgi:hypothetical protein